jgi:predicted Zn-dependent peptidase
MYEKIVLPNGVRILHENIPHVRSVSLGVWIGTGSRNETAQMNGASHFIEHMLFKGTANRTAAELAFIMDAIGG